MRKLSLCIPKRNAGVISQTALVVVFMTRLSGRITHFVKDFVGCVSISRRHRLKRDGTAAFALLRCSSGDGKRLARRDAATTRRAAVTESTNPRFGSVIERLRFKRERRSVNRDTIGIGAITRRISHGEDLVAFLELSRSRGPGADFLHDARHVPTTIRLESSLLKDFVRCLSIAARHAARLRRTQTERRVSIGLTVLARNGRSAIASPVRGMMMLSSPISTLAPRLAEAGAFMGSLTRCSSHLAILAAIADSGSSGRPLSHQSPISSSCHCSSRLAFPGVACSTPRIMR